MVKNWVNPYYVSYNTTKVVLNVAEYIQNNKKYFVYICLFFYDVVVFTGNFGGLQKKNENSALHFI